MPTRVDEKNNPRLQQLREVNQEIRGLEADVYIELSEKNRRLEALREKQRVLMGPPYVILTVGAGGRFAFDAQGRRVHEDTGEFLDENGQPIRKVQRGRPRKEE